MISPITSFLLPADSARCMVLIKNRATVLHHHLRQPDLPFWGSWLCVPRLPGVCPFVRDRTYCPGGCGSLGLKALLNPQSKKNRNAPLHGLTCPSALNKRSLQSKAVILCCNPMVSMLPHLNRFYSLPSIVKRQAKFLCITLYYVHFVKLFFHLTTLMQCSS